MTPRANASVCPSVRQVYFLIWHGRKLGRGAGRGGSSTPRSTKKVRSGEIFLILGLNRAKSRKMFALSARLLSTTLNLADAARKMRHF